MHPFTFFTLICATFEVLYSLKLEHDEHVIVLVLAVCTAAASVIVGLNHGLKPKP